MREFRHVKYIDESQENKLRYIYIATTPNLEKRRIYKIGKADNAPSRMTELTGYGTDRKDRWEVKDYIEVPSTFMPGKSAVDKDFHEWLKYNYGITPLKNEDLNQILHTNIDRSEKELFRGYSSDQLYKFLREFFYKEDPDTFIETDWSRYARTPAKLAEEAVNKIKEKDPRFFDLSRNLNVKVCDIACKDATIINALIKNFFIYSNDNKIRGVNSNVDLIVKILSNNIYAYCLMEERRNIIRHIISYITTDTSTFGKIDGSLLNNKVFKNFFIEYSEDYSAEGTINKINTISNGMKFDAIVINPPYATTGGGTIHLDFTEAALKLSDKVVSIFPFGFIYSDTKVYQNYKKDFSERLVSVEEKSSSAFADTHMRNVGIYNFEKFNGGEIKITDINGKSKMIDSLVGASGISNEEQEIFDYLGSVESCPIVTVGSNDCRGVLRKNPNLSKEDAQKLAIINSCKELKAIMNNNYYYGLIVNRSNGRMNGKSLTSRNGQIFNNYNDIEQFCINENKVTGYNILLFNTQRNAINCKKFLDHSLMRFGIYRSQIDQQMYKPVYRYVPNIDWSKVKNDVDILLQCGCPKDKAEKFVKYADNIIYRVDHGERP